MKKIILFAILFLPFCWQSCGGPKVVEISRPTFEKHYTNNKMLEIDEEVAPKTVSFEVLSEKEDTLRYQESVEKWFTENSIKLHAAVLHEGFEMKPLKAQGVKVSWIGDYRTYSTKEKTYHLSHVIEQGAFVLFFYGSPPNEFKVVEDVSLLVVRDQLSKEIKHVFDFSNFIYAPEYTENVKQFVYQDALWAYIDNSVLYVSHAHWTYSNTTKGHNGYITAIDLNKKQILWRSAPRVCNAINFVLEKDIIICAYGFTREGAKIYALDRKSGKVVGEKVLAKIRTGKKHIEYLYKRSNMVLLKAFDGTEYKVKVSD